MRTRPAIFDEWAQAEQRATGGPVSEKAGSGTLDPMPDAAGHPPGDSCVNAWVVPGRAQESDQSAGRERYPGLALLRRVYARAGEPTTRSASASTETIRPRACGGTLYIVSHNAYSHDPSPRVRGNLTLEQNQSECAWSIPARAGEPRGGCRAARHARVYPRPCGGTGCPKRLSLRVGGLSPRVRGNLGHIHLRPV